MTSPSPKSQHEAASKGGSYTAADSVAKAAALAALHSQRRGRPVNDPGRHWPRTLKRLEVLCIGSRAVMSLTQCAAEVGINIATLNRWLGRGRASLGAGGKVPRHLPTAEKAAEVKAWLDQQAPKPLP